jgi:hypothetical protein
MHRSTKLPLFAVLLAVAARAERPAPIATLDLNGQWPGAVATSLAFASEDTIAIAGYPGSDTVSRFIITIDWQNTKLRPLKSKSLAIYGGGGRFEDIYGVSNSRILSAVAPNPQLWSRDLNKLEDTPIRVFHPSDTKTGGVCFDLDSPDRQFGMAGQHHADLSPSGRFVAVVDGNELHVYVLPASCAAR